MGEHIRAALAAVLRAERAAKQMTQAEVAAELGVDERTVIRQEKAQRDVSVPILDRYATLYGVTASALMAQAERREQSMAGDS